MEVLHLKDLIAISSRVFWTAINSNSIERNMVWFVLEFAQIQKSFLPTQQVYLIREILCLIMTARNNMDNASCKMFNM